MDDSLFACSSNDTAKFRVSEMFSPVPAILLWGEVDGKFRYYMPTSHQLRPPSPTLPRFSWRGGCRLHIVNDGTSENVKKKQTQEKIDTQDSTLKSAYYLLFPTTKGLQRKKAWNEAQCTRDPRGSLFVSNH